MKGEGIVVMCQCSEATQFREEIGSIIPPTHVATTEGIKNKLFIGFFLHKGKK